MDFLLSTEIIDDIVIIDTFGSTSIAIDYDIHDLISKKDGYGHLHLILQ